MFDAWAAILRQVPASRLLLKYRRPAASRTSRHGSGSSLPSAAWSPAGFSWKAGRITVSCSPRTAKVDLALDTQPYSGGLTTCEALWMGVPVITYPGATFASRHSVSHLTNAGYEQFVAKDMAGYIDLAVQWAGRRDELAAIRAEMRDRVRQSPLCDAKTFGATCLAILEQAWETSHNSSAAARS